MRYVAAVLVVLLAYMVASQSDYEDAVEQDNYYNTMVCGGHWPDYDNRQPSCGGEQ